MCITIYSSLLILASMMLIQNGITSETVSNEDSFSESDIVDEEEHVDVPVFLGRNTTLSCPDLNGTARYNWLMDNDCKIYCKNVEFSDNSHQAHLQVTSKTIGNYTCECDVADCESYTFRLYFNRSRDEDAKTVENFLDKVYSPLYGIREILGEFGQKYDKFYHYERQNFSTDFQKIIVKNVDKKKKSIYLSCFDDNNVFDDKYIWLKNNVSLEKYESIRREHKLPGTLLTLKRSTEQSGNYTCICKDTSCVPYMHTYQVTVDERENEVPMMVTQKGITSDTVFNEESHEAMKDAIVENVPVFLGRNTTLSCPDLNGTARYAWLMENDCKDNCKNVEFLDNRQKLRLKVTSKTFGNYTCKCKVADCKSYTFRLYFNRSRDENVQTIENLVEESEKQLDKVREILSHLGHKYDTFFYYEKQNFSTDFQKISVKNAGKTKTVFFLSCFDENNLFGDNYTWLKNNVSLEKNESIDEERDTPGAYLVLKSSEAPSGNYTCICKDTSCVPYMHTYQVTVKGPTNEENFQMIEMLLKKRFEPLNGMLEILNKLGHKYNTFYHYERQNISTDFQKILVKNGKIKKMMYLSCFDENNFMGENYTWLKNNVSLQKNETIAEKHVGPGALLALKRSQDRSGNYTCICKDTSCVPHMHTYQVTDSQDSDDQSNLVSTHTETETENTTPWPDDVIDIN